MRAHGRSDGLAPKQSVARALRYSRRAFTLCRAAIALVKFQSEAVGIKGEDGRAAAYLLIPFQRWTTAKVRLDDSRLLALRQCKRSILSGTDREAAMSTKAP